MNKRYLRIYLRFWRVVNREISPGVKERTGEGRAAAVCARVKTALRAPAPGVVPLVRSALS